MRRGLISATAVLGLGTAAAAAAVWIALPFWPGLATARHDLRVAAEQDARLSDELKRRPREDDALNHLAARVIAGDLTLPAAADAAAVLLRDRDGFAASCRAWWGSCSPREGAARYLLVRVYWLLEADPVAASDAAARLEAELWVMDTGPGW